MESENSNTEKVYLYLCDRKRAKKDKACLGTMCSYKWNRECKHTKNEKYALNPPGKRKFELVAAYPIAHGKDCELYYEVDKRKRRVKNETNNSSSNTRCAAYCSDLALDLESNR